MLAPVCAEAQAVPQMKWDMGGCGAVLGAAQALAGIKPPGVTVCPPSASCAVLVSAMDVCWLAHARLCWALLRRWLASSLLVSQCAPFLAEISSAGCNVVRIVKTPC